MNPTDYGDQYNSLATQYQPQVDQLNSQIAALPGQQAAQMSALDQAKVNAFKDITSSANSKGVLFSGVPIDQQSTYVGTKYLPAVADLQTSLNDTKNTLLGQINTLQANRSKQAQDNITSYNSTQADQAYKDAELELKQESNNIAAGKASAAGQITPYQQAELTKANLAQYKSGTYSSGNKFYTGPAGAPISAATYAAATGTGLLDLLRQSGSAYDKKAYNDAQTWLKQSNGDENFVTQKLQQHYGALF